MCAGGRANLLRFLPRRQQRQGVMDAPKQSTGDHWHYKSTALVRARVEGLLSTASIPFRNYLTRTACLRLGQKVGNKMFHFQSARAGDVNDQSLFQTFCHRPTWPKTIQSLFQMVCSHQPTWPRTTQSAIQTACRGPAWPTATQPERVSNCLSPTDLARHDPERVSNFLSPTDLAHHYQERLSNCLSPTRLAHRYPELVSNSLSPTDPYFASSQGGNSAKV